MVPKGDVFLPELPVGEGPLDREFHEILPERLRDVIKRPHSHGLHGGGYGAVTGDDDDEKIGIHFLQKSEKAETVHAGHPKIGDHEVVMVGDGRVHGFPAVGYGIDTVSPLFQQVGEISPAEFIVFGDENDRAPGLLDHGRPLDGWK